MRDRTPSKNCVSQEGSPYASSRLGPRERRELRRNCPSRTLRLVSSGGMTQLRQPSSVGLARMCGMSKGGLRRAAPDKSGDHIRANKDREHPADQTDIRGDAENEQDDREDGESNEHTSRNAEHEHTSEFSPAAGASSVRSSSDYSVGPMPCQHAARCERASQVPRLRSVFLCRDGPRGRTPRSHCGQATRRNEGHPGTRGSHIRRLLPRRGDQLSPRRVTRGDWDVFEGGIFPASCDLSVYRL